MGKIIQKIKLFFKPPCKHGFEIKDVCNLKIDPCCKLCGKTLSEIIYLRKSGIWKCKNPKCGKVFY